jgi:phosphoribosylaminoimidazole-succinocarboxamide synthase
MAQKNRTERVPDEEFGRLVGKDRVQIGERVATGKVKNVYEVQDRPNEYMFKFTDKVSVFDKPIPTLIPIKGASLAFTAAQMFELVERLGYNTHFLGMDSPIHMRVRRVEVVTDSEVLRSQGRDVPNTLIPLEFITRYHVAGSMYDGLKDGTLTPRQFGLTGMPKRGDKLESPVFEATTKFRPTDDRLTREEALEVGSISEGTWNRIRRITLGVDSEIQRRVDAAGLIHVDGKKEFALDQNGEPMIVDSFGTADEDRWWNRSEWERDHQNAPELSKEFVRQYYRRLPASEAVPSIELEILRREGVKGETYHEVLMSVRSLNKGRSEKDKLDEPKIRGLPREVTREASQIYQSVSEAITGESLERFMRSFDSAETPGIS